MAIIEIVMRIFVAGLAPSRVEQSSQTGPRSRARQPLPVRRAPQFVQKFERLIVEDSQAKQADYISIGREGKRDRLPTRVANFICRIGYCRSPSELNSGVSTNVRE